MLACGHSVEASLTTDVTIAIGVEQVACLADVLATNTLPPAREGRTEPQQMSGGHVPTKLLLTGQTVTLVLLAEMTEVEDGDMFNNVLEQSDPRLSSDMLHSTIGEAMPLLQASLFNPLFSKQTGATDSSWEVSCFRTSVSSTENPIPIGEHSTSAEEFVLNLTLSKSHSPNLLSLPGSPGPTLLAGCPSVTSPGDPQRADERNK